MTTNTEARRQAGRLGGLATVARYGKEHMAAIGRKGAAAFWAKYTLFPMQLNDFAIVRRDTGEIVNSLNGVTFSSRRDTNDDNVF
jgi:general stress protein YciG